VNVKAEARWLKIYLDQVCLRYGKQEICDVLGISLGTLDRWIGVDYRERRRECVRNWMQRNSHRPVAEMLKYVRCGRTFGYKLAREAGLSCGRGGDRRSERWKK
jgi:hypothetical protein